MLQPIRTTLALLAVAVASAGCFTVNAELPGTLRNDVAGTEVEKVGDLNVDKGNWFFVWGLLGSPPKDFLSSEIKKQVQAKGADGVANLKYESQFGCIDLAITSCTFSLVSPRSYKVTGDIVRIKRAPLPGRPAKVAKTPAPDAPVVASTEQRY